MNQPARDDLYCFSPEFASELLRHPLHVRRSLTPGDGDKPRRSPGPGLMFLGYKEYEPGDDIRYLDVHKLVSCQKLLIKQFESSADEPFAVLVDASASMYHSALSASPHKAQAAINLACALAFSASASGCVSRLGIVGSSTASELQGGSLGWSQPLRRLVDYYTKLFDFVRPRFPDESKQPTVHRTANAGDILRAAALRNRHHLAIVSDFWYPWAGQLAPCLAEMARLFRSIYLLQIIADDEHDVDKWNGHVLTLTDSETGADLVVKFDAAAYKRAVEAQRRRLRSFAEERGHFYSRLVAPQDSDSQRTAVLDALRRLRLAP